MKFSKSYKKTIQIFLSVILFSQSLYAQILRHPSASLDSYQKYLKDTKQVAFVEAYLAKVKSAQSLSDEDNHQIDACLFEIFSKSSQVHYVCDQSLKNLLSQVLNTTRKSFILDLLEKYNSLPTEFDTDKRQKQEISNDVNVIRERWKSLALSLKTDTVRIFNGNNTNTNRKNTFFETIRNSENFKDSILLINGELVNFEKFAVETSTEKMTNLSVNRSKYTSAESDNNRNFHLTSVNQWALISNTQAPLIFTGTFAEFQNFYIQKNFISRTSVACSELENIYSETYGFNEVEVYLEPHCQLKINAGTIGKKPPINYHLGDLPTPPPATISKKTWIMIGLSAAALSLGLYLKDKEVRFKKF